MNPALRRYPFRAMGSPCEIQFTEQSRIAARRHLRQMLDEISRLEHKYSRFLHDSFLSRINATGGSSLGISLDAETRSLFDHAQVCYQQSGGLFDVTAGILYRSWDFIAGKIPSQAELEKQLPCIGFDKLRFRDSRLFLPAGMEIDFGGIVKEYAADAAARLGSRLGIGSGLINLGGDFAVIGKFPEQQPWPIGIVHPEQDKELMARLWLSSGGLASSGDYERCFSHEGKRYSHILNPQTGWPCEGLRAVSVCADSCTLAGSVSTIAMLKPEQEGIAFLTELGLDHVYMTAEQRIGGKGFVIGLEKDS